MNEFLKSRRHFNRDGAIGNALVHFDTQGRCKGIMRYSGAEPLPERKEIGQNILDEAKKQPHLYEVSEPEATKPATSKAKAETMPVTAEASPKADDARAAEAALPKTSEAASLQETEKTVHEGA